MKNIADWIAGKILRFITCIQKPFAFALVFRADMSIKAVAERSGMRWKTVKNIEKDWLEKKYRRVPAWHHGVP